MTYEDKITKKCNLEHNDSISTYNGSIFDHPVVHPGLFKM